ncbi:GNAT family N-acetyltransferase [Kroppenstedtia pulmonis]|uniref:GNAT family N-acetyltransferase n=1 Tax=Kroppenstedtia pulmonis TaxID=1380685 RepID=A0A7D3XJJ5_9BACL|nr:GNAT family N-acetyltransferase [Kroppenstedtia pulmonis]QKG84879.1 GNAT family N-acetyltransferase [Kroppenstedtia pulmonis]
MIETKHLFVIPLQLKYAKAATEGRKKLESIFPYHVSTQWPSPECAEILPSIAKTLDHDSAKSLWHRLVIHKGDRKLIGEVGCKGQPDSQGKVEIGYGIVPEYRNRGYASEVTKAWVQWLLQRPEIHKVTATCKKDNPSSARVLEKAGFKKTNHDQDILYWENG